jgi:hypothetical protein
MQAFWENQPLLLRMTSTGTSRRVALVKNQQRHAKEDGTSDSHSRENLKSYTALTDWAV